MLVLFLLRALAVATLALWPFIPVFFLQVHGKPSFWRKLGVYTYLIVLVEMIPIMIIVITFQGFLLGQELALGSLLVLGALLFVFGVSLNAWTAKLLGWKSLIAYSELKPQTGPRKLVKVGPFSLVRHPTYLAHTLIFVGIFLMTGFAGTGVLALIDLLASYFLIIPLEERELAGRFGGDYRRYQKRVPKFFPVKLT
jgi:protein-S-isoprenylcysteine O-methyltransferase Ste14